MEVRFKKLTATAKMPTRAHATDAGMDLYVDKVEIDEYTAQIKYYSGISIEIPKGYVGLLFPRSSICYQDIRLSNCVGVIDSGFLGNISAVFDKITPIEVNSYQFGDRFAQLIIMPYPDIELVEADELTTTDRGEGGYGSTGK